MGTHGPLRAATRRSPCSRSYVAAVVAFIAVLLPWDRSIAARALSLAAAATRLGATACIPIFLGSLRLSCLSALLLCIYRLPIKYICINQCRIEPLSICINQCTYSSRYYVSTSVPTFYLYLPLAMFTR